MSKLKSNGTALITGAAKRIGYEIALNLAEIGYDIVIHYNNSQQKAQEVAEEIKEKFKVKCEIISCDLCTKDSAQNLADFMVNNFSNWNLLVNNASIFNQSTFLRSSNQDLYDNFNIHLFSPLILSKEFAKNAKGNKKIKNAQIINMIDKNITRYETRYFDYLLSKKSLAESTKILSLQLSPEVRVNGIAPGFIISEEKIELRLKDLDKKIPLKKKGDIKNIIQAVNFLLINDFVTGQIISIDGGASLNHAG